MGFPFSVETIFVWLALSAAVALWAHNKGNSGFYTFIGAVLISPILMAIVVAVTKPDKITLEERQLQSGEMKRCPDCAELIRADAHKCRFCGSEW